MGIVGQTFVIFILVLVIAFLVSVGINYSVRTQIQRTMPKNEALLAIVGKGELDDEDDDDDDYDDKSDLHNINHDISKFEKLKGPDIFANDAAVEEVSERLHNKIGSACLCSQTKENLHNKVDNISKHLNTKN
jgi:uncharacterized protein YfkK (UPF0435 family)